ncbi:MAG: Flp pilus assembly protein CpaB [Myxococcota bacterium]
MEWRDDLQPARAGDAAARERVREYLTPFAHGVCLAWTAHHQAELLVPRVLDEALANLKDVADADVGPLVMAIARRVAQQAPAPEQSGTTPAVTEARQLVGRLRELAGPLRERLFLRVIEGIPGPELAEVGRLAPAELRSELERAATEAARVLGQPQSFSGDGYLWESLGAPPPLLAQLELQLPVLRFDPTAAPLPATAPDTAGTFQELQPVGGPGGLGGPMKKLLFADDEHTSVSTVAEVSTEPGVDAVAPPKPLAVPNPFEPQVPTIAASDLPAEARGQLPMVPWPDEPPRAPPPPSRSGRQPALPPRPVPAPREGEVSGRSGSGRSRPSVIVEGSGKKPSPESSQSGRQPPMPTRAEVTKDAPKLDEHDLTQARVPAPIARQAEAGPESMLGRPTIELPTSAAVSGETRVQPIPIRAIAEEDTSTGVVPRAPPPPPGPLDAPILKGSSPLFLAAPLVLLALLVGALSLFRAERQAKASWQLVSVLVAAEDLSFGDVINVDNVAVRAVPQEYGSPSGMVTEGDLSQILDQRILADVQTGDPLFWVQFSQVFASQNQLSRKVPKHARGVTVPVSTVGAVGHMVHATERVDVVVSITAEDKGPDGKGKGAQAGVLEPRSVTILQNVTLLAVGKANGPLSELALDERERAFTNVTLLLTPEEAELVTLATNLGKLHLTLRNEDDQEVDLERGFSNSATLLDGNRRRALQKHRAQVIQVIRAAQPDAKRLR